MPKQRPDIREQSYLITVVQDAGNEEESIYGHIAIANTLSGTKGLGPVSAGPHLIKNPRS